MCERKCVCMRVICKYQLNLNAGFFFSCSGQRNYHQGSYQQHWRNCDEKHQQYATVHGIVSFKYEKVRPHIAKLAQEMCAVLSLVCPTLPAVISRHYFFQQMTYSLVEWYFHSYDDTQKGILSRIATEDENLTERLTKDVSVDGAYFQYIILLSFQQTNQFYFNKLVWSQYSHT